ncbi:MAG TPA: SUMF1/EgtB/PvdO family nonheme iron enzyme [Pyrinomonadaceae bacterium]|jgi:hypothetical protein
MSFILSDEERKKSEQLLLTALESADADVRRPIAEAKLSHRLRQSFQRIDERREIDLQYLTCAEYQLFLDDSQAEGKNYQPDHWTDSRFPAGTASHPVRGVRPEDAEAFCAWLTRWSGDARYRLPTSAEAEKYPVAEKMMAAWCRDTGEFKLTDLNESAEQEAQSKLRELSQLPLPSSNPLDWRQEVQAGESSKIAKRLIILAALLVVVATILSFLYDPYSIIVGSTFVAFLLLIVVAAFVAIFSEGENVLKAGFIIVILSLCGLSWVASNYPFHLLVVVILIITLFLLLKYMNLRKALKERWERFRQRDYLDPFLVRTNLSELIYGLNLGLYYSRGENDLRLATQSWIRIYEQLQALFSRPNQQESRLISLVDDLVREDPKETASERRFRQRRLTAELFEDLNGSFKNTRLEKAKSNWFQTLRFGKLKSRAKNSAEGILGVYWWLRIVVARKEGKLPAWEGVRLIREYRTDRTEEISRG